MGLEAGGPRLEELFLPPVGSGRPIPPSSSGHPKLPKYLKKQERNLLIYTEQAISRAPTRAG